MRTYEMMVIFHPTLDESAVAAEAERTAELIKSNGGEVTKISIWGRRKLAYAVNDQLEGSYVMFYFALEPSALKPFEFNLKLDDNVLRFMTVKADSVPGETAPTKEVEAAVETVEVAEVDSQTESPVVEIEAEVEVVEVAEVMAEADNQAKAPVVEGDAEIADTEA